MPKNNRLFHCRYAAVIAVTAPPFGTLFTDANYKHCPESRILPMVKMLREKPDITHNPKVVGSNPASAIQTL